MPRRFVKGKDKTSASLRVAVSFIFFALSAALVSAHLDAGFDAESGPYLFDVGWTPENPVAGQSTLIAINVLDSLTKEPANVTSAWIRLELKDRVAFAGTLALEKGAASVSYVFADAGTWTVTVQSEGQKASGRIQVVGNPSQTENWAWLAAAFFAVVAAGLALKLFRKAR